MSARTEMLLCNYLLCWQRTQWRRTSAIVNLVRHRMVSRPSVTTTVPLTSSSKVLYVFA